jgi:hypothetical protein
MDIENKLKSQFKKQVGYKLNLDNPRSLNEKLQWLKLYDRNPLITQCTDKYLVREYVKEQIGEKYLIPLLGVWDNVEDIDFSTLPNQFVLKVNWGSGLNIIVRDKNNIQEESIKSRLREWLKPTSNHYYHHFEWGYKHIQPKITCEELIARRGLECKIMCNNGKPDHIYAKNTFKDDKTIVDCYFNLAWKAYPFYRILRGVKYGVQEGFEKPWNLSEMLEIASKLSGNFIHVSVDMYVEPRAIYFGELTFCPLAGMARYEPGLWDLKLGKSLVLPIPN